MINTYLLVCGKNKQIFLLLYFLLFFTKISQLQFFNAIYRCIAEPKWRHTIVVWLVWSSNRVPLSSSTSPCFVYAGIRQPEGSNFEIRILSVPFASHDFLLCENIKLTVFRFLLFDLSEFEIRIILHNVTCKRK